MEKYIGKSVFKDKYKPTKVICGEDRRTYLQYRGEKGSLYVSSSESVNSLLTLGKREVEAFLHSDTIGNLLSHGWTEKSGTILPMVEDFELESILENETLNGTIAHFKGVVLDKKFCKVIKSAKGTPIVEFNLFGGVFQLKYFEDTFLVTKDSEVLGKSPIKGVDYSGVSEVNFPVKEIFLKLHNDNPRLGNIFAIGHCVLAASRAGLDPRIVLSELEIMDDFFSAQFQVGREHKNGRLYNQSLNLL